MAKGDGKDSGRKRSSAREGERQDRPETGRSPGTMSDSDFDLWLRSGLKSLYDPILSEPLPDDIVKLVRSRKRKQDD